MLRNRLYFGLKPFVPSAIRLAARRHLVARLRPQVADRWPILPGSERPPEGWPGWPEGKQFALLLTHDVEGEAGLRRVRALAEYEMKLGFRSSFNFIPDGPYQVPAELRQWLVANGFEVGVHDLHHDGKLYRSREDFRRNAARINRYLAEWQAVGFRSGFMLNRLEWMHDLKVAYDASTFDTDPFEPQPEGMGSIFPFWIPGPENHNGNGARAGYVELPYTLPQDSTLFLLMQETSPAIWLDKLDWVARHGGMAAVIVHPDYVRLPGEPPSAKTFPIEYYGTLLEHIRTKHANRYWHVLPREVAAFTAAHQPPLRPKPKRICMLCYSHYQTDARVTRYADSLAERGDHVDVIALRRSTEDPVEEKLDKVNLICPQARVGKKEKSPLSFLLPLLRFLFSSTLLITRRHARQRYDLLHIHNMPDFLVFAAWYPKLTGARILLDIHDIVPELFANKFGTDNGSATVLALKGVEYLSARFSDHVIVSNHLWQDTFATRTGTGDRCTVFINNVDARVFAPRPRTRDDGRIVILFPGGLQWHQGLDIALRAFQRVSHEMPHAAFHIYGDGIMKAELVELAGELGFNGNVRFFEPLPVREIARVMAEADLGVVPKRADSFGNEAYSTKIMEFMSLGVPVVISNTKIDKFYFDSSVARFFESGNHDSLAEAILDVLRNDAARGEMVARARDYAARNSWDSRKQDYLQLVDTLANGHGDSAS
jgi:glycosyltransferase involved in cell wall biosynthesis